MISTLDNINNENKFYTQIILIYASFSFITTLIREINKDIEDVKGDLTINALTLPIKIGIKKSATLNCYFIILTVIFIACIQYLQLKNLFCLIIVGVLIIFQYHIVLLYKFYY